MTLQPEHLLDRFTRFCHRILCLESDRSINYQRSNWIRYRGEGQENEPFFVWHNTTRTHILTHLSPEYEALVGEKGFYGAAMTEADDDTGALLDKLDELGVADNTIVIYSSDNGAEVFSWPDGGTTPFRGEKATTWEGGFRVPYVVRWPGVIKPGTVINDIFDHMDWLPTFLAAASARATSRSFFKAPVLHRRYFPLTG